VSILIEPPKPLGPGMNQRTDLPRNTKTRTHELFKDREEKANLESRNGLLQFDEVIRFADEAKKSSFTLLPSTLRDLHRLAIQDIYDCAGNFREGPIRIGVRR
jgi:fido (protein-threonine AMPylation protein)